DAAQEVRNAQELFDAANRSDDTSLNALADGIMGEIAPADQSLRPTLLTRSLGNDHDARITTLGSDGVDLDDIPVALAEALEDDPSNQQVMVTDVVLGAAGTTVASVIVGARVDISRAGPHNLYLI